MEVCISCDREALWNCTSCNEVFCEKHKVKHEKVKNRVHNIEKTGKELTYEQVATLKENLLKKINIINESEKRITKKLVFLFQKSINCVRKLLGKLKTKNSNT